MLRCTVRGVPLMPDANVQYNGLNKRLNLRVSDLHYPDLQHDARHVLRSLNFSEKQLQQSFVPSQMESFGCAHLEDKRLYPFTQRESSCQNWRQRMVFGN